MVRPLAAALAHGAVPRRSFGLPEPPRALPRACASPHAPAPRPSQMYSMAAVLAMLAGAEAFNAPMVQRTPQAAVRLASVRMADAPETETAPEETKEEAPPAPPPPPAVEYSDALPFLTRRASLGPKGALVGDVGFDPLGFTEIFPLVRAAARPYHSK